MNSFLLSILLSCAFPSTAQAQSRHADPDEALAERKARFSSDKALIAPLAQPLPKIARPAFHPAFELFRDSGAPWGQGRALGALWVYELPDQTRIDGLASLPGSGIIVAEGGENSYRHRLTRLDQAGVPASSVPVSGYFMSLLAGNLGGKPALVAQDMYHLQVLDPSGEPRWKDSLQMESAALCDLDRDGRGELVGGVARYKNELRAVRGDGRRLWDATVPADHVLGSAAADLGGKEGPMVAVFAARRGRATVHLLDGKGSPVLDYPDDSAPEIGVLGRFADGTPFLATVGSEWQAGHDRLRISRLAGRTRKLETEADVGPTHVVSIALADFTGDRSPEIVLGTDNGWVLVYGLCGRLLSQRHFFGQIPYLVPEAPDADGRQKVLVGVRGASSLVYSVGLTERPFAAPASASGASETAPAPASPGWPEPTLRALEAFIETGPEGPVVFSADDTLWAGDAGSAFLRWLIAEGKLARSDGGKDLYAEYEALAGRDRAKGRAFAATLMAGMKESEVRDLAAQFFSRHFLGRIYRPMTDLVAKLRDSGRQVWVVSASNRWIVEAAAEFLRVEPERVLGPVPDGARKPAAVKKRLGRRPVLAVGSGRSDRELLRRSAGPALLVTHGSATDPGLLALARKKGWLVVDLPLLPEWKP
ncbi:MAG: haloacid dehalogenase-like hydrolase [Elusimicrobia bacterium]|nr:haloacid dehalogenase-like hydrolase [Elusimicrobiota bacterium]